MAPEGIVKGTVHLVAVLNDDPVPIVHRYSGIM